ncbi:hypothetical protein GCM10023351_33880 [Microbacterium gilvum]|uniref:Uncharacterized protein n=1 Tax=Microbacterium gilvum TaxID=1336204 RepID=A0ABP9AV13_9MICO
MPPVDDVVPSFAAQPARDRAATAPTAARLERRVIFTVNPHSVQCQGWPRRVAGHVVTLGVPDDQTAVRR